MTALSLVSDFFLFAVVSTARTAVQSTTMQLCQHGMFASLVLTRAWFAKQGYQS